MTPGNHRHLAAFGFHLRQQRCLLLGRPLPAPLNPRNDLDFCQSHLLLERQKATPGDTSLGGSCRDFYTRLTGRLRWLSEIPRAVAPLRAARSIVNPHSRHLWTGFSFGASFGQLQLLRPVRLEHYKIGNRWRSLPAGAEAASRDYELRVGGPPCSSIKGKVSIQETEARNREIGKARKPETGQTCPHLPPRLRSS